MSPEGTTIYGGYVGTTPTQEFDPRGGALGIENPYSGGGGYGGGAGYGDAQHYNRCEWEGSSIPCAMKGRLDAVQLRVALDIEKRTGKMPSHLLLEPSFRAPSAKSKRDTSTATKTTKTDKPKDDPKKGSTVEPSSVPSSTAGVPPTLKHPTAEETAESKAAAEAAMKENPNVFDEGSSPQGDYVPLPENLGQLVKDRAGAGSPCEKAIIRLVNTVATLTGRKQFKQRDKDKRRGLSYVESLFKTVEGKIKLDPSLGPFQGETGSTEHVLGGAKIRIGPATQDFVKQQGLTPSRVNDQYVFTTLHELVHRASKNGRYTDPEVLRAAIAILEQDGKEAPAYTDVTRLASTRINTFFRTYCPNPN